MTLTPASTGASATQSHRHCPDSGSGHGSSVTDAFAPTHFAIQPKYDRHAGTACNAFRAVHLTMFDFLASSHHPLDTVNDGTHPDCTLVYHFIPLDTTQQQPLYCFKPVGRRRRNRLTLKVKL